MICQRTMISNVEVNRSMAGMFEQTRNMNKVASKGHEVEREPMVDS